MNGKERVMRALRLEQTDRVPVIPEIIQHGLEISGASHGAYSTNDAVMAQTIIAAQEYYQYDAVYVSTDNYILAEAFGGIVNIQPDDPPQMLHHPLQDGYDTPMPSFSIHSGRLPVIIQTTKQLRAHYQDEIFIKTNIDSAPFSAAACLRNPEYFLADLFDEDLEQDVLSLLQLCTDAIVEYGTAVSQAGAHGIAFGDSVAGLLGREFYQRFALPFAKQAIARLHDITHKPVFYHVCGDTNHILDLMMQTGADCVEIDSMVKMEDAKRYADGVCALEGNISTIEALYTGTKEDVRREANSCIAPFGNRGGFILSSACEVPRETPRENLAEIMKAAIEYPYET